MGVFEQLATDADREAASHLARYLIETEGNRFYRHDIDTVRNHIAGNDQLMVEAHKFKDKLADMQREADLLANTIEARAQRAAAVDPVKEMMDRYMSSASRNAFSDRIEKLLKQRTSQKT